MSVYAKERPSWLGEALNSVFEQTVSPSQVVLVCDGPLTAELDAVIDKFKDKLTLVRLEKNCGLGTALNEGLKHCSYDLVARMDSDDIALPDRFEKQLKAFVQDKDLTVYGGAIQEIDAETKEIISLRLLPCTDRGIKQFLKTRSPFNHVTVMFKKTAVENAGSYQPFYFVEDYYLWARMSAKGCKFGNSTDVFVNVRIDRNMFARRGGWKYFKSNKAIAGKLLELGLISYPTYLFNLAVRFCVQVLMPNKVRSIFYKKALR